MTLTQKIIVLNGYVEKISGYEFGRELRGPGRVLRRDGGITKIHIYICVIFKEL